MNLGDMKALSPASLAPLADSLRELCAVHSAVDDDGVGALTGMRSLTLRNCKGVGVHAVARMRMLRSVTVSMEEEEEDEFALSDVAAGWTEAESRGVGEVVGAPMAHLESVRVMMWEKTPSNSYEDSFQDSFQDV